MVENEFSFIMVGFLLGISVSVAIYFLYWASEKKDKALKELE